MSDRDEMYENAKRLARDLERKVELYKKVLDRNYHGYEPWENIADELEQRIRETPLCVEKVVTYRVTLGTGGPAMGVDWHPNGNAQVWWQDWFTEKVYADLDSDAAETLAMTWAVGDYDEGFHDD